MGGESLFMGRGGLWEIGLNPQSLTNLACLYGRCRYLPIIVVMEFGRQGQRMFLSSKRELCVATDSNDPLGAEHLELEVCVVRDDVKASECCSTKQGMMAAA